MNIYDEADVKKAKLEEEINEKLMKLCSEYVMIIEVELENTVRIWQRKIKVEIYTNE